ncbi:transposase [bacterium]|nr:transposase [bacterium]
MPDFDYSTPGAYFVTVCTHQRIDYFDNAECGRICREVWEDMVNHHPVRLDQFIIMPDHVHFIIWICEKHETPNNLRTGDAGVAPTIVKSKLPDRRVEACLDRPHGAPSDSLPVIVGSFKSAVTRRIRAKLEIGFGWQRSFYDHVICTGEDLRILRDYILNNPLELATDLENRAGAGGIEQNVGVKYIGEKENVYLGR